MHDKILPQTKFPKSGANYSITESRNGLDRLKNGKWIFAENESFQTSTSNKLLERLYKEKKFRALMASAERVDFTPKDFIYRHGEPINYVYFPETMVVSEYQIVEDGRTVETALIGNEGMIGSIPIFPNRAAANWFQPVVGGSALKIDIEIFTGEFYSDAFHRALYLFFESYIKQVSQRVVCLCFHQIEARLCNWLLMLYLRSKSSRYLLSHEEIARSIGVHRPSITQTVKNLRKKGLINYGRREIVVLDWNKMRENACECFELIKSSDG